MAGYASTDYSSHVLRIYCRQMKRQDGVSINSLVPPWLCQLVHPSGPSIYVRHSRVEVAASPRVGRVQRA